jgi:hypothetical protein
MALVTPNVGEVELLDKMLKDALSSDENYILKLYNNDYTPVSGSTAANFTAATFTNYAHKTLTRTGWGAASTVSNKASSTYSAQQSWTCGATGDTVYGYWVIGATSTVSLWAERFGTPRTLANGDILNLTPKFTLNSEN